jgi:ankyrin repeat protein
LDGPICRLIESLNSIANVKQPILAALDRRPNRASDPIVAWSHLRLLYLLCSNRILSAKDITDAVDHFVSNNTEFTSSILLMFCFFAPWIRNESSDLFDFLTSELDQVHEVQGSLANRLFIDFRQRLSEYQANDWALLHFEVNNRFPKDSLASILKNDDLEALSDVIRSGNVKTDQRIFPALFVQCPAVQNSPTLLQFCAFFGSVRCFDFLLERNANLQKRDKSFPSLSLAQFAVAGGHSQIIEKLKPSSDFKECIHIAARFHRTEYFDWLLSIRNDITAKSPDFGTVMHQCAVSNNITGLSICFSDGALIDEHDEIGRTPLYFAAMYGSFDIAKVLISQPDIDINAQDVSICFS